MKKIDDILLAAYLEGSLSDNERDYVENAIEKDNELKSVVDEWISMADELYDYSLPEDKDDRELRMEACRRIEAVMNQVKKESGYNKETERAKPKIAAMHAKTSPLKQKWPIYRKILVAASVLAFVSTTGLLLFRSPSDSLQSNGGGQSVPSFDVPMGGTYMSLPTGDTTIVDTNLNFKDYSGLYN